ncbi:MAG: DNA-3-methyladenine glycosylase family protein [Acidimicrobiia bacterium]
METTLVPIDFRLDLRSTLSNLQGWFRPDGWWSPMRTPEGPATLHLRRGGREVEAKAFGTAAGWALSSVSSLIGVHDSPGSLVTDHPLVAELHRRHPGLRMGRTGRVFEALVVAILTQKVTGKEAHQSLRQLRYRFSDPAPGPESTLRLPPDPDRLANSTYFDLHPLGIEKRRADTLLRAARKAVEIDRLATVPSTEARAWLERLPGIGVWTSAETVTVSHGDPDAVSVGDFHLKNVVAWHLTGCPRGSDEEMMVLLEEFRPNRGRVVRLLETLGHAPAFGPRLPIRSFASY